MWRFIEKIKDRHNFNKGRFEPEFSGMFAPYHGDEVVSLDCETTSLNPREAEIVSIAAVVVSKNRIYSANCFDVKIKAPKSLTAVSIKIHKLRVMDLQGGMPLEQSIRELLLFVGNRPIMGYFIEYDVAILEKLMRQYVGFGFPNKIIEISRVFEKKISGPMGSGLHDLRLDTILNQLDLPSLPRHNALDDAITVGLIYIRLCSQ